MEIFLPESDTGGNEKSNQGQWDVIAHISSATQKQQINAFERYLSILSKKTKEIDEKVQNLIPLEERILKAEVDAKESLQTTRDTRGLVFFGFFALVFVVLGIAYGYWEFVFNSSRNEDYKYGLSEKLNNNENQIKMLKLCLYSNKWLNPKCLEN